MINLFGEEIKDELLKVRMSKYQRIRDEYNYRPGIPELKRSCRYCAKKVKFKYHNKTYYKCTIIGISRSEATDIRLGDMCDKWEEQDK